MFLSKSFARASFDRRSWRLDALAGGGYDDHRPRLTERRAAELAREIAARRAETEREDVALRKALADLAAEQVRVPRAKRVRTAEAVEVAKAHPPTPHWRDLYARAYAQALEAAILAEYRRRDAANEDDALALLLLEA